MPPKKIPTPSGRRKRLCRLSCPGSGDSSDAVAISLQAPAQDESSKEKNREASSRLGVTEFKAPPVDEIVLPRFLAGANQHFDDVVDLYALPPNLQRRVTNKAPFV